MTDFLYSRGFDDEESNLYGQLAIGTLEQEIKLLKIQLIRLLQAQHEWDIGHDRLMSAIQDADGSIRTPAEIYKALVLDGYECSKTEGVDVRGQPIDQTGKRVSLRKRDYSTEIHNTIKLIGALEIQHKELMKQDIPDSERIAQIARDLRAFTEQADKLVPDGKE